MGYFQHRTGLTYQSYIDVDENWAEYYPAKTQPAIGIDAADYAGWAICGLCVSWIPVIGTIIGWLTFYANYTAPQGSRRYRFSRMACALSTAVFICNAVVGAIALIQYINH